MPSSYRHDAYAPLAGTPKILTVPGLNNSGPDHWQTHWEDAFPWFKRVELGLWDNPDRHIWVQRLDNAIRAQEQPVILAAHSMGCLTVAWWAAIAAPTYRYPVAGALLVAPADPEQAGACDRIRRFGPAPRIPLPFPSILVASRNDPYADYARSAQFAAHWGSHLVDAGEAGHLNAETQLGHWPLGLALVDKLTDTANMPDRGEMLLTETAALLAQTTDRQALRP